MHLVPVDQHGDRLDESEDLVSVPDHDVEGPHGGDEGDAVPGVKQLLFPLRDLLKDFRLELHEGAA